MNDIQYLAHVLDDLHLRVPKLSNSEFCGSRNDFHMLHATLSMHMDTRAVTTVEASLRKLQSSIGGMCGFAVSVFYPFAREDHSWPVVQWIEGEDKEAFAIFEVDVNTTGCSWIIHRGVRSDPESSWRNASIEWNVADIGHLKTLFYAAQHLFGILEWSSADSHKIYCEGDFMECSQEEYEPSFLICS